MKGINWEERGLKGMYLGERMRPWRSQSNEEERNHSSREQAWRHQCYLGEAWEARRGTRCGKTHHCLRRPSLTTGEKDQYPSSSSAKITTARPTQTPKEKKLFCIFFLLCLCISEWSHSECECVYIEGEGEGDKGFEE